MGTWGAGIFENDGASDYLWEVGNAPALATLMKPIDAVIEVVKSGDDLELPLCEEAVAAAEMLAALRSGDRSALPQSAAEAVARVLGKPSPGEIDRARAVVERIVKDSEMSEAFAESDVADTWLAVMQGLRARLG